MNTGLVIGAGLVVAALIALEVFYSRKHVPELEDSYEDLCRQVRVPDVSWLNTLFEIRGLPDGRRSLVFDWGLESWVEEG